MWWRFMVTEQTEMPRAGCAVLPVSHRGAEMVKRLSHCRLLSSAGTQDSGPEENALSQRYRAEQTAGLKNRQQPHFLSIYLFFFLSFFLSVFLSPSIFFLSSYLPPSVFFRVGCQTWCVGHDDMDTVPPITPSLYFSQAWSIEKDLALQWDRS